MSNLFSLPIDTVHTYYKVLSSNTKKTLKKIVIREKKQ